MPRVRQRGGQRNGTPGTTYPNRTDLAQQPSLPARAATGQTYGKAQSQLQAQHDVPMRPAPLPLAAGPQPSLQGPGAANGSPSPAAPGPSPIPPGAFGDIHRPTERPNEPVTAGASLGPGPGPEAIAGNMATTARINSVSTVLAKAAAATGSPVLQQLASRAQQIGQ